MLDDLNVKSHFVKNSSNKEKQMEKKEFEVLEVGNMPVILAGVAAAVLAIIGLAGIIPSAAIAISAIAIGVALILVGVALGVEKKYILSETILGRFSGPRIISSGIGMEVIAGIASLVLGILAFLHTHPIVLLGADVIVLGMTLLYMCGVDSRLNKYRSNNDEEHKHNYLQETVSTVIDAQFIVGLGAIALGILAILHIASATLILISFLSVGITLALKGITLAARLTQEYRQVV